MFVGQYPAGVIDVLDASNLASLGTIGLPGCCALQFALDPRTQTLYAATGTNYVYMINAATNAFERSVEVAQSGQNSTNAIAADNMTGRAFVASSPGGSVVEIDGAGGRVSRVLKAPNQAAGLAVDTKTQELYVANYHQLTVFDARGTRAFLLILVAAAAVVAVGAVGIYVFLRRREERERREVEKGAPGGGPGRVG